MSVLSYESDLQRLEELRKMSLKNPSMEPLFCVVEPSQACDSDILSKQVSEPVESLQQKYFTWNEEDAAFIEWFQTEVNIPKKPFRLKQGVWVSDCEKFYAALRDDINDGFKGIRARFGCLKSDLLNLKKIVDFKEKEK